MIGGVTVKIGGFIMIGGFLMIGGVTVVIGGVTAVMREVWGKTKLNESERQKLGQ